LYRGISDFMYTEQYTLPGGTAIPTNGWCCHTNVALLEGPDKGPQIFKRKCSCSGKVLCPSHLLPHVRIYTVADYFDMNDLKTYARQGEYSRYSVTVLLLTQRRYVNREAIQGDVLS
jgi:hypothetical protein